MKKALRFPVLLAAGCAVAGLNGMVYHQLSVTVRPDYFHAFPFQRIATLGGLLGSHLLVDRPTAPGRAVE